MNSRFAQYLNEIVSLTMMALLIAALAAGEVPPSEAKILVAVPATTFVLGDQDVSFRHNGE